MNNQYTNKISELQDNLNQKEKTLKHIIFENDMLKEKLKEFKWNIYFKLFVSVLSLIPLSKLLYISVYKGLGTISTEIILNIVILIYLSYLNISEKTFKYNFKVKNSILTELKNSNKKINILQKEIEFLKSNIEEINLSNNKCRKDQSTINYPKQNEENMNVNNEIKNIKIKKLTN